MMVIEPLPAGQAQEAMNSVDSWKVYLLECADSTYYCGVAKHIDRRVAQHNGLLAGGAKYTRSRRPVKLLAFAICSDKREAYRLEYTVAELMGHTTLEMSRRYSHLAPDTLRKAALSLQGCL